MRWFSIVLLSCTLWAQSWSENQFTQQTYELGQCEFATKLTRILYKNANSGNLIFSPINIYSALAVVHLGAEGNTRDEIAKALGFPSTADNTQIQQIHETLGQLLKTVQNTSKVETFGSNCWEMVKSSIINVANGLFVQNGLNLVPSYVNQVLSYYQGQVSNVDFAKEPSKATDAVNEFVSKNTNGRIPKLFSSPISSDVRVLLAASLYFKAAWDSQFSEIATKEGKFNSGSTSYKVKFMERYGDIPYVKLHDSNLQLESISLAYAGLDTSIHYILPSVGQSLDVLIASLNSTVIQRIVRESRSTYVHLKIPKMKYKWQEDINNPLNELGIAELFSDKANLKNIASDVALKVSQATHAAEIEINEKGTEASAITVIKMVPMSGVIRPPPIDVFVDRPFYYIIRHEKTGSILFSGVVNNPNGEAN